MDVTSEFAKGKYHITNIKTINECPFFYDIYTISEPDLTHSHLACKILRIDEIYTTSKDFKLFGVLENLKMINTTPEIMYLHERNMLNKESLLTYSKNYVGKVTEQHTGSIYLKVFTTEEEMQLFINDNYPLIE